MNFLKYPLLLELITIFSHQGPTVILMTTIIISRQVSVAVYYKYTCLLLSCRYRVQSDRKVAVCSIHPTEQAILQCLLCVKAKISVSKSYHCSPKCFSDAWQHHRSLHERAAGAANENGADEDELFGRFGSSGSVNLSMSSGQSVPVTDSLNNGSKPLLYPTAVPEKTATGETLYEVGRSKTYTPTGDDVGHILKFECVAVDAETRIPVGPVNTFMTSRVIPAPSPTPRRLIPVSGADLAGQTDLDGRISNGTFSVLSYNILSDVFASSELYGYCPSWALSWPYRRQNLLREIVSYGADILCLQEVCCAQVYFTQTGCFLKFISCYFLCGNYDQHPIFILAMIR